MESQTLLIFTLLLLLRVSQTKLSSPPKKLLPVPQLYFSSEVKQCSIDSPELYYDVVGFPNLNSLFDEGKLFFGILMDKLESSVSDPTEKEKVEKEWKNLAEVVTNSLELAAQRIDDNWVKIIDDFDTKPVLPWELSWRKIILVEEFLRLYYEYQILEAVLKSGVKEIVASLQTQMVDVIKKLDDKVENHEGMSEQKILTSVEKTLKKLEPNFMGKLLMAMVQRAMNKKNAKENLPAIATYVAETVEKITLTIEAYTNKGDEFPRFWTQMTQIMKKEGTRKAMSIPDLLTIYGDDELVILNVISLLSKHKGHS